MRPLTGTVSMGWKRFGSVYSDVKYGVRHTKVTLSSFILTLRNSGKASQGGHCALLYALSIPKESENARTYMGISGLVCNKEYFLLFCYHESTIT